VHDRSRAADAILAQSDMVGEPSPGYHDEPLAGLMTLSRAQRPLFHRSGQCGNTAETPREHFTVVTCRTEPSATGEAKNREVTDRCLPHRDRPGHGNPGQRDATGKR
jgi:hypothetical protein